MHSIPSVATNASFSEVVGAISEGGRGIACILSDGNEFVGVVTDGDLRRAIEKFGDISKVVASDIMGNMPSTVAKDANLYECEILMRERQLTSLIVVDGSLMPVGVIKSFDA